MPFLEDYVLLEELGQGGFATVYKVKHRQLGYIRAVRVIHQLIAQGENDATYQKFLRECRILLRLGNGNHPNIVHIYQPLLRLQKAVVEMDYIDGEDLSHYLKNCSGFAPVHEVIRLVSDISSALAYCHEDIYRFCMDRAEDNLQDDPEDGSKVLIDDATRARLIEKYRVIHNDLHSGNVIRRGNGSYVLLDFGLAIDGDEVVRSSRAVNGAPEFKAPEKWDDESLLTPQSDIYSFGVMLYEYLTGRVPFPVRKGKALSLQDLFLLGNAHKTQVPDSIYELRKAAYEAANPGKTYERDYPQWLEDLVMKCLEKKPEDRFKNGKELYDFAIAHMEEDRSGALLEAIENLKTENADLKAENEALKAENAGLKAEMAALKPEEEGQETAEGAEVTHNVNVSETSGNTTKKSDRWLWWMVAGLVAVVVCLAAFEYSKHFSWDEAYCEDLSNSGRANCYIVSEKGSYKFPTVKGNSSESVGAVKSVEVLWESFGTSIYPEVGDLIKSVSYSDGYITFQTADAFKEGNAVIAAINASGTILWSWHIWLTDQPGKCVYANNAGTMMDRNLGATSATPGEVGALGLLYQWGRKDPFLGSFSISSDVEARSTITWPSAVSSSSSRGTVAYATEHPTTFITYNTNNTNNYDWYYSGSSSTDNTRWQSTKTIYDPCPAGWRVPDGGSNGVWNKAGFDDYSYDSYDEGILFGSGISSPATWYPAAGFRYGDYGNLFGSVGNGGHYWSVTPNGGIACGLDFYFDDSVLPTSSRSRAYGQSVRCLQE